MASSGNFENVFRTGYALRLEWKINSQSIENNTSNITATLYLVSKGSSYTINSSASKPVKLTIGGTTYSSSIGNGALSGNQKRKIMAKTVNIAHDADGTKSIKLRGFINIDATLGGTKYNNIYVPASSAANVTLDAIPRATTPTTSGTFNVGSSVTINTPGASDDFTHTLAYSTNNSTWTTIASNVATSATWTLPSALATAIPKAKVGMVYIRCTTYNGNTNIGAKTITRSYSVTSAYASPSVALTASQTNSGSINATIKGKSTMTLNAAATLKYGTTAAKYVFKYGSVSKTVTSTAASASVSFLVPANAGSTFDYSVTVTDTRGFTATKSGSVATTNYTEPSITKLEVTRGDYDGTTFTENKKGNSLKIEIGGSIASVKSANAKSYKIEYRLSTATAYTTLVDSMTLSSYSVSVVKYTDDIFSENSAYVVRATLIDSFSQTSQIVDVPTQKVLLNFSANGKAVAIGGIATVDDSLEVAMEMYVTGGIRHIVLANDTDFDEIVKTGVYVGSMNTQTHTNSPMSTGSFLLEVMNAGTSGQLMQRYSYCHKSTYRAFVRFKYESTWGAWQPAEGFISSSMSSQAGRVRMANGFLVQWGRVLITPTAANTITAKAVQFPIEYDSIPICQVSANSAAPNIVNCSYTATATELTIHMTRTSTTNTWISWVAFGVAT